MSKKSKSEKNFFMRHKVMTIIGAVVVVGIIASAGGDKEPNTVQEPIDRTNLELDIYEDVQVDDLLYELDSNPMVAKSKYEDKNIWLVGTVSNIDSDGKYFCFRGNDDFSLVNVQIYVDEEQRDGLMNIEKGSTIGVAVKITDVGEVIGYSAELLCW